MQKPGNDLKKSGIFDSNELKMVKRQGKPCIFDTRLSKNLTLYLFDFFKYRELSDICSANIFFHNCFIEYEMSTWKMEMMNIIEIFHLDIKDPEKEIDNTLTSCIKKNRIYPVKNFEGNYVKIDKEGINIISLVYYDPDMQAQLEKHNSNKNNIHQNVFNFVDLEFMDLEDDFEEIGINHKKLNTPTPWISFFSENSYVPGNIIYLDQKSPLDFGFSFYHVMKDNYKFYLHHFTEDMRNAKLRLQIIINDQTVYEMPNFPSKEILEKSSIKNPDNKLNDVYICDINKYMFEAVKNSLKNSLNSDIDLKNSIKSNKSTESNSLNSQNSLKSVNSFKSFDSNNWNQRDYTVRIRFINTHLFWKAGWYIDGGRLVRSVYKIEK